jgi:Acetyltransferase (GNAT) domain
VTTPAPVKIDVRATTPRDAAALSDFLGRVFQPRPGASLLAEQHMAWKYWTHRPDWPGSRSFVAQHEGAIVAHGAAWPVRVNAAGQPIAAMHVIDWAAHPDYPGAGIWLLRQMARRVKLTVATGGSEITRRILPVIGFRQHGEVAWYARPVRPLGQVLTTTPRDWKTPARWLRNTSWRLWPQLTIPAGWSATPLAPDDIPEGLWPQASPTAAVTVRDAGMYRYVVDATVTQHRLFGLQRRGQLVGFFCLAFAPHVARIADLWLRSAEIQDWAAGFRTAAALAARHRDVYEISASASTTLGKQALTRAGFRLRDRSVLSLFGDATSLQGRELHIQMLDSDASSVSGATASYLT